MEDERLLLYLWIAFFLAQPPLPCPFALSCVSPGLSRVTFLAHAAIRMLSMDVCAVDAPVS
eukprot:9343889-Pyramimonas_sp.AAC.1